MNFLFLFDTTGYAAAPFTARGHTTYIVDILNTGERATNARATHVLAWDIIAKEQELVEIAKTCSFVFGFPPCTDLAGSGARHFDSKETANEGFQGEALDTVWSVERIGEEAKTDWAIENPVGMLNTYWRAPDFIFDPSDYGGYLPKDDVHPDYPEYINPRDAYPKKTCLWHSEFFMVPPKRPVSVAPGWSKQTTKLGGKSLKTKMIRSASPRGFFEALAQVYTGY